MRLVRKGRRWLLWMREGDLDQLEEIVTAQSVRDDISSETAAFIEALLDEIVRVRG